jgi:hypothetical protein
MNTRNTEHDRKLTFFLSIALLVSATISCILTYRCK